MKDKEYHVANFATFVSWLLLFPQKNGHEGNFRPVQYCIDKNIWTDQDLYLGDFKMDVIKWQLNLVLCNFGLKSYLWF